MQYVNALAPSIAGERVGVGVGWKWAPIGGLQYQTQMQAPKYDVQFLRSEAWRSSSSSSSRTRQIKECKISKPNRKNGSLSILLAIFQIDLG